jgi:hypothetical protein
MPARRLCLGSARRHLLRFAAGRRAPECWPSDRERCAGWKFDLDRGRYAGVHSRFEQPLYMVLAKWLRTITHIAYPIKTRFLLFYRGIRVITSSVSCSACEGMRVEVN